MFPIQTILHPTDFSERSESAFLLACALAKDHGSKLVLLHVVQPLEVVMGPEMVVAQPEPPQEDLRARLEQLHPGDPAIAVQRLIKTGRPAAAILQGAEEAGATMIVMGTHGRTGLHRLVMGSVAEEVVRKAKCPVLTIKDPIPSALPAGEDEKVIEGKPSPALA